VHLLVLDSFDGTLVAGRTSTNRIVVSRLADGRVVARHSFPNAVTAVRVQRSRVAVQTGRALSVFDLATGRSRRFQLAYDAGAPRLMSLQGGLVSYVAGPEIHLLRLADGRDVTLRIPQAAEPVGAEFVSSGFYYSYNLPHVREPGRVSFISRTELEHVLR
jgi:hypothetical protein